MTKMITLLSAAYVGGVLRHPHEGSIPVSEADRDRLVGEQQVAIDETDGFTDKQLESLPEEPISVDTGGVSSPAIENPHLSQVAPPPPPETKPARKPSNSKE